MQYYAEKTNDSVMDPRDAPSTVVLLLFFCLLLTLGSFS